MHQGTRFKNWIPLSTQMPQSGNELVQVVHGNRQFHPMQKLDYGDHGLETVKELILAAIQANKRIVLYADYDVDGTMSCVSWIWFLRAIGYSNFNYYIPCRFKEGYGVNLQAVQHLIDNEAAEVIITMDTGITANEEARYCKERDVLFICTDHHKIQPQKMPDCTILNPKQHPDPMFQELCGCGITFVLLRKLGAHFKLDGQAWTDLLALVGMATICDVVPLNGVNHRLARMGVEALFKSQRPVLKKLRAACALDLTVDEKDVGFRLGPRINAVGRLRHAELVIKAFVDEDPDDLIQVMDECNEERKAIQQRIVFQALEQAVSYEDDAVMMLGGDWHPGVVGIAASKIAEQFWRPTWMFQRKDGIGKGSARSVPGFDVTEAMTACKELFIKFGGHQAAGGFTFDLANEQKIRDGLNAYALSVRDRQPEIWESKIRFDCAVGAHLLNVQLADLLQELKPFGHGFEEPVFQLSGKVSRVQFYQDKVTGEPKHTAVFLDVSTAGRQQQPLKIMFFNEVIEELEWQEQAAFLVTFGKNTYRGHTDLALYGKDWRLLSVPA